jgi:hypothetical protein
MARCLELNGSLPRCLRAASFQLMGKYSRTVFKDARYAGMKGEKIPYAIARNKVKSTVQLGRLPVAVGTPVDLAPVLRQNDIRRQCL